MYVMRAHLSVNMMSIEQVHMNADPHQKTSHGPEERRASLPQQKHSYCYI